MQPAELAKQCVESLNQCTAWGLEMKDATILVVTPRGWKAPPRFPRGKIVQWKEDGSRVRYLPAMNVLAWLAANFPDHVKIAQEAKDEEASQVCRATDDDRRG